MVLASSIGFLLAVLNRKRFKMKDTSMLRRLESSTFVFFVSISSCFIFPNLATANNCSNMYKTLHESAPRPSKDPINPDINNLEDLLLKIHILESEFERNSDQPEAVRERLSSQKERKQTRMESLNSRHSKILVAVSKIKNEESINQEDFRKRAERLQNKIDAKRKEISNELEQLSGEIKSTGTLIENVRKSFRNEKRVLLDQVQTIIDSIAKVTPFDGILRIINDPQSLGKIGNKKHSVIQKIILSKIKNKTSDSLSSPEEFYNQMLADLKQFNVFEKIDQKSIAQVFLTRLIQDKKLNDRSIATLLNRLLDDMPKIDASYLLGSIFFDNDIVNLLQNKSWISFGVLINRTVNSFKDLTPEDSKVNGILNNLKLAQASSFSFLEIDPINILESAFRRIRTFHSDKEIQNSEVYSNLTIQLSSSDLVIDNIFRNLNDPETAKFTINYLMSRRNTAWAKSYYSVEYRTIRNRVESTIEFYESVMKAHALGTIDQRSLLIYTRFFQYLYHLSPLETRVYQGNDVFYSDQQKWQERYDTIRNFFMTKP